MAKIFETREDVEREHLSQKVFDEHASSNSSISMGIADLALGMTTLQLDTLLEFQASTLKEQRNFLGKLNKPLGYILNGLGALAFVTAFSANSKAKKAEAELARLGPEQIMYPPDAGVVQAAEVNGVPVKVSSLQVSVTEHSKSL